MTNQPPKKECPSGQHIRLNGKKPNCHCKEEWEKEFIEKGADLEHQRWVRWQNWCHKVLRENCLSSELEKTLERWDKQITTPYSKLSEQEKESDRKETRNYLPLIRSLLFQTRQEEADKYLFMSRKLAELVRKETIKETIKETLKAVLEIIDKVYKKEKGIHNWLDLREKIRQRKV